MRVFLLLAVLVRPAFALDIEHEEYKIIGWNNSCAVAIERYAYPVLGQAIHGEPITTRIGTLSIVTAKPIVETRWVLEADGANTFNPHAAKPIRRKLRKAGYERPGFHETIRDAVTSDAPGAAEVILSTGILEARPDFWPDTREWRLGQVHYNPLSTCALMIYSRIGERERFKFLLTRIYNASARIDRGRAHTTNGRQLFNAGDLPAALAETAIGARMAPEVGGTRYHYAAMLALSGYLDAAVSELIAAVELDAVYAEKADTDVDFDSLRVRQDFRELILGKKRPPLPGPP